MFSGGLNGRKVWKKMRANIDLADLVTQFSSDLEKIRIESILNMEEVGRMRECLADSLWVQR